MATGVFAGAEDAVVESVVDDVLDSPVPVNAAARTVGKGWGAPEEPSARRPGLRAGCDVGANSGDSVGAVHNAS